MIVRSSKDTGGDLYILGGAPDFEALSGDGRIRESYDPHDWSAGDYTYSELDRALFLTGTGEVLWRWDGTDRRFAHAVKCPECGSTNLGEIESDGTRDCGDCGIWFSRMAWFLPTAIAVARLGNDWHGGGASRGYRLLCVAMRYCERHGARNCLDAIDWPDVESAAQSVYKALEEAYSGKI